MILTGIKLMCRPQKIISIAVDQAYNSNINIRHGAVITKGNKIICKGCNTSRTQIKSLNNLELCSHAEMNVARMLYNTYIFKKERSKNSKHPKKVNLKKYIIWVARISHGNQGDVLYSAPCSKCVQSIKRMGFQKIGFSLSNNETRVVNIHDFFNDHLSLAQQDLEKFLAIN